MINNRYEKLVSVIIPTYNSQETIELCLNSIKRQTHSQIEIIVVDNHSRDETVEIAKRYGRVYLKGPERCVQRNFGAREAKGKYLLFIDSDMELSPRVIDKCIKKMEKHKLGGIIIPEISIGKGYWARCKALERICYHGDDAIEAARFFTRETFFKVNGYDENLVAADDWDLSQRVKKSGFSIGRISCLIKHHEGTLSLVRTMKKKYLYGQTISRYIKKHRNEIRKQFNPLRRAYFKNWKKLAKDPFHTLGFIVMKLCEFGAGGAGFIKSKWGR
ncbi:unnamed protein product [marine sediment metagenome]|uniref:Uncharacterized protein n=1 Tax=marine sediment metagenome TaxID=412755 RepID=X1FUU4_9ZZZZ